MARCEVTTDSVNVRGEILRTIRCTREAGHPVTSMPDVHRNFRPGHRVLWVDDARPYHKALRKAVADGHVPHPFFGVPKEIVETYMEKTE